MLVMARDGGGHGVRLKAEIGGRAKYARKEVVPIARAFSASSMRPDDGVSDL